VALVPATIAATVPKIRAFWAKDIEKPRNGCLP
jgi:hypothetical protein